jgi:hypothetical protein
MLNAGVAKSHFSHAASRLIAFTKKGVNACWKRFSARNTSVFIAACVAVNAARRFQKTGQ